MKGVIWFDVDGVLRDFEMAVWGKRCDEWMKDVYGVELFQFVNGNLSLLETAPVLEYLEVVKYTHKWLGEPVHILTRQPDAWVEPTRRWLQSHFGDVPFNMKVVKGKESKLKVLGFADLLVDDHPELVGCPQVATVAWSYNKVRSGWWVHSPADMSHLIHRFYAKGVGM